LPAQTDVKRSLDQPIVPTQLSQAPDSLPPSFELTFLAEMALKLDQALQTHTVATEIPENQLKEGQPTAQAIETPSQPINTESAPTVKRVELTLSDVVVLAVENNRSIKNAYLERIAQRQDLAVAEDKFVPNFTPTLSLSTAQLDSDDNTTTNSDIGAEARVSVKIPTGGELSVGWTVNDNSTLDSNDVIDDSDDDASGQNLDLSFNQPLLRGAGVNVNTASVKIARFTEQSNILALKSTLIDTVTDAIIAYRELLRAQERVKIDQQSLALAQETLNANQVLIEAGRLAPVDIVQSETAVANRQVSLLAAQNNLESTKLALLDILDIDQTTEIVSAELPKAEAISLDPNNLRELAFTNRPDYLQAQLSRETAQLDLSLAEDNRRWDLSLVTSLNNRVNSTSDVRAGLRLTHDFGDLTKEQRFQRSRVNLLQAENSLEDLDESLEIQVKDGIRNVNLRLSQVELARQATELSERQLEIERQKQRLGRGDGIFELVRLQNELVDARNAELNATIDYLNALTRLDQSLGTTLDTWQVTIEKE
jgi:outer membrane protein TolC